MTNPRAPRLTDVSTRGCPLTVDIEDTTSVLSRLVLIIIYNSNISCFVDICSGKYSLSTFNYLFIVHVCRTKCKEKWTRLKMLEMRNFRGTDHSFSPENQNQKRSSGDKDNSPCWWSFCRSVSSIFCPSFPLPLDWPPVANMATR